MNQNLRKLLQEEPNYREDKGLNWPNLKECLINGLDEFILNQGAKNKVNVGDYNHWKEAVLTDFFFFHLFITVT